jgi:hypothetical protein
MPMTVTRRSDAIEISYDRGVHISTSYGMGRMKRHSTPVH